MRWIYLEIRGPQAQAFQTASRRAPQRVTTDAARNNALVAEQSGHVREDGGRSAKLLAFREHVPEQLAQADSDVVLIRHRKLGNRHYGLVFWRSSSCAATLSSRSASSLRPSSRYACPRRWCGIGLLGSMASARCKVRIASSVSPFFSSTLPNRIYGPVEEESSQMDRCSSFSASSNF